MLETASPLKAAAPLSIEVIETQDLPPSLQTPSELSNKRRSQSFGSVGKSQQLLDLPRRLWQFKQSIDSKIEGLKEKQETVEMAECTFKPRINPSSRVRSVEEIRIKRPSSMQQEPLTFKPSLCQRSLKLLASKRKDQSVFLSLYKHSHRTPREGCEGDKWTFVPIVNATPRKTPRNGSISDHLYNDALRRQTKQTESTPSLSKLMNKESEKYLVKKITAEFKSAYQKLGGSLSYSLFIILLQNMGFIKNDPSSSSFSEERNLVLQAWNSLSLNSTVPKGKVLHFLLSVLNLTPNKIHKTYYLLALNKNRDREAKKNTETYSFKPTLSEQTIKLASQKAEEHDLEFLVNEGMQFQEKWKRMRMDKEKEEMSGLDFHPTVNKLMSKVQDKTTIKDHWAGLHGTHMTHRALSLYCLSMVKKEQAKQAAEDAEQEADAYMARSYFTPRIRNHYLKGKKPIGEQKGVTDLISRLKRGREEKEKSTRMLERSAVLASKGLPFRCDVERKARMVETFRTFSAPRNSVITKTGELALTQNPFTIKSNNSLTQHSDDSASEDQPVEIAVKLPSGNIDKMVIYSEEDKPFVVEHFIVKHGLTGEIAAHLREGVMSS